MVTVRETNHWLLGENDGENDAVRTQVALTRRLKHICVHKLC